MKEDGQEEVDRLLAHLVRGIALSVHHAGNQKNGIANTGP
jgi:hypothetical protein